MQQLSDNNRVLSCATQNCYFKSARERDTDMQVLRRLVRDSSGLTRLREKSVDVSVSGI